VSIVVCIYVKNYFSSETTTPNAMKVHRKLTCMAVSKNILQMCLGVWKDIKYNSSNKRLVEPVYICNKLTGHVDILCGWYIKYEKGRLK